MYKRIKRYAKLKLKGNNMININFEFRKGIFFIRLIGELNKETSQTAIDEINTLIANNKFTYVVINTNYLNIIDLTGINYLTKICYLAKEQKSNLVICDKTNIIKTLLNNNVPNIKDELEVL